MKTIIAGSRGITDFQLVVDAVERSGWKNEITEIFSGAARGVDILGECYANLQHLPCRRFEAEWDLYGNQAGLIRNRLMAEQADALIAIWDGQSRGTRHMIKTAEAYRLRVFTLQVDQ